MACHFQCQIIGGGNEPQPNDSETDSTNHFWDSYLVIIFEHRSNQSDARASTVARDETSLFTEKKTLEERNWKQLSMSD